MKTLIEKKVSQTVNENDVDYMGIYKELDDKVFHICYSHGFNIQTRVGNDMAYYVFFVADNRLPKVQEAIQMLEKLGLRRIDNTGPYRITELSYFL